MHKFSLNILLFASFIYGVETINISLDPISHNTFYLDATCPVYQPDLINGEYIIEGNLGSAMSVYLLENLYTNMNDSIRTNSSFLYKQGDVGYRDFIVDIKTRVSETGILKLIGNGVSYPGRISQYANDNILQNYLLHFSKNFNTSTLSLYTGYHLENYNLQHINSNSGESYFSGINYNLEKKKYQVNFRYAFQIGQTNFSSLINYHVQWGIINSKYYLTENIIPYMKNTYKYFYLDTNMKNMNIFSAGLLLDFNLINFDISLTSTQSDLYPEISFKTKFSNFNIYSGFLFKNWFDIEKYSINSYTYYFSNFSYKSNNIEIQIEPRYIYYNNNKYLGLNNKLNIHYDIFSDRTRIIPFLLSLDKTRISLVLDNNYYNTSDMIVKNYIDASLKFFEIESQNRYKKFFGVTYNGIQFNNMYSMELDEINLYSKSDSWSWNDNSLKNYFNFYIGLEFEKFIVSWHFTNILSEDYLINSNGSIQNLYMKYFTVKWKFDN